VRYAITIEHIHQDPETGGLWRRVFECDDFETVDGCLLLRGVVGRGEVAVPLANVALFSTEAVKG
jgi:hypothetical protein